MTYQYGPHDYPPPPRRSKGPLFWIFAVGLPAVLLVGCMASALGLVQTSTQSAAPLFTPPPLPSLTPLVVSPLPSISLPPLPTLSTELPPPPTEAAPATTAAPPPPPSSAAPAQASKEPAAKVQEAVLPDVVGMVLQTGQDTMQAAGFYFLDDQDDTGQHRLQILDRDWVVTRQDPPAGERVPVTTKVVLWAKKIGE
jgi:hypothetical protein